MTQEVHELIAIFAEQSIRLNNFLMAQSLGWFGNSEEERRQSNLDYHEKNKEVIEAESHEVINILVRRFYANRFK